MQDAFSASAKHSQDTPDSMVYIPCINKHMREDAMPDPTPYVRGYSFTNHQADKPAEPLPGNRLDVELDEISARSAELTERVNAGFDVSLNQEQLETVAASIDEVVFVAENMPDVRDAADLNLNVEALSTLYLGAAAANPATGPSGAPLTIGAIYYNTVANEQRTWTGAEWLRLDVRGVVYPEQFGAIGNGVADDRAAAQAAVDHIASTGGGWLVFGPKTYIFASSSIYAGVASTSPTEGTLTARDWTVGLQVPAGVSLRGVKGKTVLDFSTASGIDTGLGTVEYANGTIRDLEIVGPGSTGNAAHGVFNTLVSDGTHVKEDITFEDLHIRNWGSYGIGCGYGQPVDNLYRNILIEDVGADGIDHKVRFGPNDPNWDGCSNTRFEGITIRNHGNRVTGTSGIDVRGPVSMSQIQVLDVRDACNGITLSAGIAQGDDEVRTPSARTVLTNFKISGANPNSDIVGVNCLSGGPAVVSDGYIHWCRTGVWSRPESASPSGWRDSASVTAVIVEGSRNGRSFRIDNDRTHLTGCRSIADVQYFDEKRGFVMAGTTTFPIKGGAGTATFVVHLNGVEVTGGGVDYTIVGDDVVFVAPRIATDEVVVAALTSIAIDVNASYGSIVGGGNDEFHTSGVSLDANAVATSALAGYVDEAGVSILLRTLNGIANIIPTGAAANLDLQLRAKGTGAIRLAAIPTSSAGLPLGAVWNDAGTLKVVF